MSPLPRGLLIAFEGGEACGKSTQAALLAGAIDAVLTREPGGTAIGEQIRTLLLDPGSAALVDRAEALLMAAARAQHVAEVIRPALDAGRHVVTDRWTGSSLAYQGYGRGLPLHEVEELSTFATAGVGADLVVLLRVPPEVAESRLRGVPDRLERAGEAFHRRVARGFDELAAASPERWAVVEGTGRPEEVAERVRKVVAAALGLT